METKQKPITKISEENKDVKSMFDTVTVNEESMTDGSLYNIFSVKPVRSVRQTRSVRRNHSLPIRSLKD